MKLWILDADVIIDLLSLDVFDNLVDHCELYVSTTVVEEVRFFKRNGQKIPVDFRAHYVETAKVIEKSASVEELHEVGQLLPPIIRQGIDPGELESLAVLNRNRDLIFCSMDGLAIKSLPFLDLSSNGISVEQLLRQSGVTASSLKSPHTEKYFQSKLKEGQEWLMYST